jgi:hypothetical protein
LARDKFSKLSGLSLQLESLVLRDFQKKKKSKKNFGLTLAGHNGLMFGKTNDRINW